ncbi:zinc-dependent alcohol dehydrogenase family protein [Rhizosaccharibacter radicis]|uniref:enoyl-[acyl-carrier-protein] reductase n=1 Tax=Rhizosaccharibacter radicis TaxID=2782605 RepID=A0ABT1W0Y4_9PROT|nr:zinc-dependent alcohol dehydrogenase family protein [Acetobacteraceae bacterium KSS12]
MSATIAAVHLVGYGEASEKLVLAREPDPGQPGPGEVLVAVEFAPINHNDLMVVWGVYAWRPEPPIAIGNEGAGIVLATGAGVESPRPGDRVVLPFMVRSWREKVIVPADEVVPLPADADPAQASMMAINAVTAAMLLDDYLALEPGDGIVFNAATSGLGRWVAALAAQRGLRAVGLVRRREDVATVREACPEVDVIADDEDMTAVRARHEGSTIRLALDGVAGTSTQRLAQLLAPGGTLVSYGAATRQPLAVPAGDLIFRKITVRGFWEGHPENMARVVPILRELAGMIGPNSVRQPVAGIYTLDRLHEAVAHAERRGRVLLDFRS